MGTILASTIIDTVSRQLFDIDGIRWPRTELLAYLSQGQRLIASVQPSASSSTANFLTAAGTKQTLPTNGTMLLDVGRNMGTSGTAPGQVIGTTSRKILDAYVPDWHYTGAAAETRNYVYDPQSPRQFYISPPSLGTHYIEITYATVPVDIASEATAIALNDAYETALINFVLFRAYSKNTDYAPATLGQEHLALFNQAVGGKVTAEQANNPNMSLFPPSPQTGGVV